MRLLRQILRHLLTIVLVVSLVPGLGDLVESAEHLLHGGHLPHSEQAQAEEAHTGEVAEEHGCTPMSHHCSCHVSTPATLPTTILPERTDHLEVARFHPRGDRVLLSGAPAPPTRPPIA